MIAEEMGQDANDCTLAEYDGGGTFPFPEDSNQQEYMYRFIANIIDNPDISFELKLFECM